MARRSTLVGAVCAAVLAGCGGHSQPEASGAPVESPACRVMAAAAVDDARALLRAYAGDPSPGDLAFYNLREVLTNIQARCRTEWLGGALDRGLTHGQTTTLYSLLPSSYVTYLRQSIGCARAAEPPPGCARPRRAIRSPGANGTGATPHPLVP